MKLREFPIGSYWKKTWLKNGSWIIFKVIDNEIKKSYPHKTIVVKSIKDYNYGLFTFIIVDSDKSYKYERLKKEDVFLEVI